MTGFGRGPEDDEALVVAARRRALADSERRELDAALDADPTLRIAHDVGRAFDDVAFVRPGDEAVIARAVDRTLGIPNRRGASRPWSVAVAFAAGFLLIASVAAAYRAGIAIGPRLRRAPAPAENGHDSARRVLHTSATAPRVVADPGAPIAASAALDPRSDPIAAPAPRAAIDKPSIATASAGANVGAVPDEAAPAPTTPPPFPTASAASRGASAGNVTAADLFQRAGAARRAGSLDTACALYGDLQAQFPAAEEARVSQVSLGKLLLELGRPQEAEHHFAIYLASDTGALAAEATFGRAQSLERMGRVRDERDAWLGLLRDFPSSVYAGAARRRLAALGPESP